MGVDEIDSILIILKKKHCCFCAENYIQNVLPLEICMQYQYCPNLVNNITKTSPCNEEPLTPHFYIIKVGFTGVFIIFLFLL